VDEEITFLNSKVGSRTECQMTQLGSLSQEDQKVSSSLSQRLY